MILGQDRTQLDAWLGDVRTVLLVLRGSENGSKAREVDDFVDTSRAQGTHYDPFQHQVLITDTSNVTPAETLAWFQDRTDCYAVLRNRAPTSPKIVVKREGIDDLLFPDAPRDPDYVQIRLAFLTP